MRHSFLKIVCLSLVMLGMTGCETVYTAFIGVDDKTKARFTTVPQMCENGLTENEEISACTRELMPLGREYGLIALQRIQDYGEYALPETKKMLPEFKEKIEQNCFAQIDQADELFNDGKDDVAVEIALGSLSDCFFRGDAVMERSYGDVEAAPLRMVTDRALQTLFDASLSEDYYYQEG